MYTLQGKTRSIGHTHSTLDSCMVSDHTSHAVHVGNLSQVTAKSKQAPTPKKSLGDQRQTGPAVALGHLIPPPMRQPWSRRERFWPSGYPTTLAYWAHKHQHTIVMFNTCSREPTHRSLTDTGGGYNLRGAGLPQATPRPSQPMLSTFHLRAPPGLRLSITTNPNTQEWEAPLDFYCNLTSKHSRS
jgi:hypothetical protein